MVVETWFVVVKENTAETCSVSPLTPFSVADDAWMAWQFHDPGQDAGAVQAFRREGSGFFGIQLRLRGLDPRARYEVVDLDRPGSVAISGRILMQEGLEISIRDRPGSAVVLYRKAAQGEG